jgi:hypothetical protein
MSDIVDTLRQWLASPQRRLYASFFDWPDKKMKELGILKTLFESMECQGFCPFHSPSVSEKDPPDCVAFGQDQQRVAFEVTELVSEKAVKMNKEGKEVYFEWTESTTIEAVEMILRKKESRLRNIDRSQYSELVLVIHTDEPTLLYADYRTLLLTHRFQPVQAIAEAYLLFSYDPSLKTCGHVRLSFDANNTKYSPGV